jgi:hypothetical protein
VGSDAVSVSFSEVSQAGIDAFMVCREVHEEAASTFYRNNTFKITRFPEGYYADHDLDDAYIAATVEPWFKRLGTNVRFLDSLDIDLDAICPMRCLDYATASRIDVGREGLLDLGQEFQARSPADTE